MDPDFSSLKGRPGSCGPNSVCTNTAPGYYCSCALGFYDDFNESPQAAWDRIASGLYASDPNATYIPMLSTGGEALGDVTNCTDANECDDDKHDCDANLLNVCENTEGSFVCVCAPGTRYVVPGPPTTMQCEDIDECTELLFVCDPEAACVNDIMEAFDILAGRQDDVCILKVLTIN